MSVKLIPGEYYKIKTRTTPTGGSSKGKPKDKESKYKEYVYLKRKGRHEVFMMATLKGEHKNKVVLECFRAHDLEHGIVQINQVPRKGATLCN